MRIACVYFPRNYYGGGGKFQYIEAALRNLGHDVRQIQTLRELEIADQECELILFEQRQPGEIDNNDLVRMASDKKALWFQWYFDLFCFDDLLPLHKQDQWATFGPTMQAMDLVLIKERGRLREYRGNDVSAIWFDQGCPSTMRQCEYPDNPEFDVVVWGSSYPRFYQQRVSDVLCLLAAGLKVGWATQAGLAEAQEVQRLPWCHPDDLPDLCSRAAVALQVDAFSHLDGFYSDRIWLAAGAGACVVRRITLGQRNLPGFGYNTVSQLIQLVAGLVKNPSERRTVGMASRRQVLAQHTYEHRCQELVHYAEAFNADRCKEPSLPAL